MQSHRDLPHPGTETPGSWPPAHTTEQPRAGAVRTTWGLTHTISTVLIQERAMLCPGTIHALCK